MAESNVMKNIQGDLEVLKRDIILIKNILSNEGELTDEIRKRLEEARKIPISEYISDEDLREQLL